MKPKTFLRLLGFEIKKNFLSPWMLVFLAALLLTNGWRIQEEYARDTRRTAGIEPLYESFYERWRGTVTPEKIRDLMTLYGPLDEKAERMELSVQPGTGTWLSSEQDDWAFLRFQFAEEMEYDYLYVNRAAGITARAQKLSELCAQAGNRYEAAKNQKIAQAFYGRSIPAFADTRHIETWLAHDFSSLLVSFLCLFGLCTVFVTEQETEMYMLQRTARLGGGATVAAKLTASALFVLAVCVLFYGQDYLTLQLLSGHFEALASPVYAIPALRATGLRMTVGQFILWHSAVKSLGVFGMACGILLLSCLCRRVLTAFAAGFGMILGLALLQEFSQLRPLLKWFNPMESIMVRELLENITFVNVFGIPVRLEHFVLLGMAVTVALLVLGILRWNPGRVERSR